MQVKNHLSGPAFDVKDELIARDFNGELLRHLFRPEDHLGYDGSFRFGKIIDTADMLSRHDEQVDRGVRICILEDDDGLVRVHELRRKFSPYNLTKDAVGLHRHAPIRYANILGGVNACISFGAEAPGVR